MPIGMVILLWKNYISWCVFFATRIVHAAGIHTDGFLTSAVVDVLVVISHKNPPMLMIVMPSVRWNPSLPSYDIGGFLFVNYTLVNFAKVAITFLMPTFSKSIVNRVSLPIGCIACIRPMPNTLCITRSPAAHCSAEP